MVSTIDIDALRDLVSEHMFDGSANFVAISISCQSGEEAQYLASMLESGFTDEDIQISRAGVRAVELLCTDSASLVLAWQGEKPEGSSSTEDESEQE